MTSGDLIIRPMADDEFDTMRAVSVAAFDDESIGDYLDALRVSWAWIDGLSFVAELGGEIVAQVLYAHAILDTPTELVRVLVLSPVGVRPDLQGQGIGSTLITTSLAQLTSRDEPYVFLEGNPMYYERFGFQPGRELGFRKPSLRIPDPAFQVVPNGEGRPRMSGTLVYADAVWLTDSCGLRPAPWLD